MRVYAYKNDFSVLQKSSSGGAFTRIVTTIVSSLSCEYSIYGAAWNDELIVKHLRIENINNLYKFNGSKYSRSDIAGIYQSVEMDIRAGKFVIFSGTPCQIFGLNQYLKNRKLSHDSLFTIDIICHGTPKPVVWKDCKTWIEKELGHRIVHVSFRDKSVGWKRYPTSVVLDNKRTVRWTYLTQVYIRMFLSLLIIEKGCFSCQFSNMNRVSDITIGDFWGIESIIPSIDKEGGVSLILANTTAGECIVKKIERGSKPTEVIIEYQGDYSKFKQYQHNLNKPTEMPNNYDLFWKDYKSMSFDNIVKKYSFYNWKGRLRFFLKSLCIKFRYFDEKLS